YVTSIKNTEEELRQLSANMRHKFQQFGDLCGFVVIGYAGRDESIMSVFEEAMRDPAAFPYGIYWGTREGSEIAPRVAELARAHPRRFHLFRCDDFDAFMAAMHEVSGEDANEEPCALELPTAIVNPYQAMEQRYQRLVEFAEGNMPTDPLVVEDVQRLQAELRRKRPWADATGDEFDLLQAQMALARRDYQSALQAITPFLEKHPKHAEGLAALGNALMIKGEEEGSPAAELESVAKWKEAIAQNSRALLPRYGLMRYYGLHHLMAEGIEVGEQLIKLVPNDVSLRRNLVQFYGQAGRYDEAERELQWLLQRDPQNADIHGNRAALLEQRGLIREAIEELRQAVSLAPQNPWTRFAFGGALAKTNRLAEAATEFEEAIRLDPRNISFRTQTAQFYLMQNQAQRALPHLQTAVSIAPLSAEAHGWLCQAWLFLQNFPAAQSEGEEAVRLSPNDTRLRLTVGMAHEQMNRPQEAEAHYVAATQANPNGAEGYVSLALLYFRQNRGAEFNGVFQRISQINPQAAHGLQMQLQQMQQTQATGARPDWLGALRQVASLFQETPPGVAAQSGWPQPPPGGNPSYRPR
ncbi:MAG: tetratricopeptide repeat protein, partial [Chthoniobacterales bacterium]